MRLIRRVMFVEVFTVAAMLTLGNVALCAAASDNEQSSAAPALAALTYIDVRRSLWQSGYKRDYKKQRAYLRTLLERSDIAADHSVADTLRLLIAEAHYGLPPPADAEGLLSSVAEDTALAEHDPLRTGAWRRLATLQSESGNLAAARTSYTQSGLSAQECSLVDATPVLRRSLGASIDYPTEALYWGFEGWVVAEFDIKPDGTTTSQRAVVAQTYRPEGGLGCGGKQYRLTFRSSSNR